MILDFLNPFSKKNSTHNDTLEARRKQFAARVAQAAYMDENDILSFLQASTGITKIELLKADPLSGSFRLTQGGHNRAILVRAEELGEPFLGIRGTKPAITENFFVKSNLADDAKLALDCNYNYLAIVKHTEKFLADAIAEKHISNLTKLNVAGHSLAAFTAKIIAAKHAGYRSYSFDSPEFGPNQIKQLKQEKFFDESNMYTCQFSPHYINNCWPVQLGTVDRIILNPEAKKKLIDKYPYYSWFSKASNPEDVSSFDLLLLMEMHSCSNHFDALVNNEAYILRERQYEPFPQAFAPIYVSAFPWVQSFLDNRAAAFLGNSSQSSGAELDAAYISLQKEIKVKTNITKQPLYEIEQLIQQDIFQMNNGILSTQEVLNSIFKGQLAKAIHPTEKNQNGLHQDFQSLFPLVESELTERLKPITAIIGLTPKEDALTTFLSSYSLQDMLKTNLDAQHTSPQQLHLLFSQNGIQELVEKNSLTIDPLTWYSNASSSKPASNHSISWTPTTLTVKLNSNGYMSTDITGHISLLLFAKDYISWLMLSAEKKEIAKIFDLAKSNLLATYNMSHFIRATNKSTCLSSAEKELIIKTVVNNPEYLDIVKDIYLYGDKYSFQPLEERIQYLESMKGVRSLLSEELLELNNLQGVLHRNDAKEMLMSTINLYSIKDPLITQMIQGDSNAIHEYCNMKQYEDGYRTQQNQLRSLVFHYTTLKPGSREQRNQSEAVRRFVEKNKGKYPELENDLLAFYINQEPEKAIPLLLQRNDLSSSELACKIMFQLGKVKDASDLTHSLAQNNPENLSLVGKSAYLHAMDNNFDVAVIQLKKLKASSTIAKAIRSLCYDEIHRLEKDNDERAKFLCESVLSTLTPNLIDEIYGVSLWLVDHSLKRHDYTQGIQQLENLSIAVKDSRELYEQASGKLFLTHMKLANYEGKPLVIPKGSISEQVFEQLSNSQITDVSTIIMLLNVSSLTEDLKKSNDFYHKYFNQISEYETKYPMALNMFRALFERQARKALQNFDLGKLIELENDLLKTNPSHCPKERVLFNEIKTLLTQYYTAMVIEGLSGLAINASKNIDNDMARYTSMIVLGTAQTGGKIYTEIAKFQIGIKNNIDDLMVKKEDILAKINAETNDAEKKLFEEERKKIDSMILTMNNSYLQSPNTYYLISYVLNALKQAHAGALKANPNDLGYARLDLSAALFEGVGVYFNAQSLLDQKDYLDKAMLGNGDDVNNFINEWNLKAISASLHAANILLNIAITCDDFTEYYANQSLKLRDNKLISAGKIGLQTGFNIVNIVNSKDWDFYLLSGTGLVQLISSISKYLEPGQEEIVKRGEYLPENHYLSGMGLREAADRTSSQVQATATSVKICKATGLDIIAAPWLVPVAPYLAVLAPYVAPIAIVGAGGLIATNYSLSQTDINTRNIYINSLIAASKNDFKLAAQKILMFMQRTGKLSDSELQKRYNYYKMMEMERDINALMDYTVVKTLKGKYWEASQNYANLEILLQSNPNALAYCNKMKYFNLFRSALNQGLLYEAEYYLLTLKTADLNLGQDLIFMEGSLRLSIAKAEFYLSNKKIPEYESELKKAKEVYSEIKCLLDNNADLGHPALRDYIDSQKTNLIFAEAREDKKTTLNAMYLLLATSLSSVPPKKSTNTHDGRNSSAHPAASYKSSIIQPLLFSAHTTPKCSKNNQIPLLNKVGLKRNLPISRVGVLGLAGLGLSICGSFFYNNPNNNQKFTVLDSSKKMSFK